MAVLVGVDIGGTFTDFVAYDTETGSYTTHKVLTTPADPAAAVLTGLRDLLARSGGPEAVRSVAHATTLATNAVIERKGARVGLITTQGFRDVLMIGSEHRYDMQDLHIDLPRPLINRRDIAEVPERITADGTVLTPLDAEAVVAAARRLREQGVEALAVGFLHSYRNPSHEQQAAAALRDQPGVRYVSVSSEVAPVIRELGRFSTTVVNAYVQPLVAEYTGKLERALGDLGITAPFLIMLSDGGLCAPADARAYPVRLIESGPASGVMAAARLAADLQLPTVLSIDMGGTTAKGAVIRDGKAALVLESEVARLERFKPGSGLPLVSPSVDLIEIGAGGGSIAWVDSVGRLRVGPESAGADPGPACYGRGGTAPTVTDADLALGFLNPGHFASGSFALDTAAAEHALASLTAALRIDVAEIAWGIAATVDANMASAFHIHSIERGLDIRDCPAVAFGGAGPVHAESVAELLGIREVLFPRQASVYSAVGLVRTAPSFSAVGTFRGDLAAIGMAELTQTLAELEEVCRARVLRTGAAGSQVVVRRSLDMRYKGQVWEIEVPLPDAPLTDASRDVIAATFVRAYEARFHQAIADIPVEVVNCRVVAYGEAVLPAAAQRSGRDGTAAAPVAERSVMFELGRRTTVPVYRWDDLDAGQVLAGPCLVETADTVAVIRPGWTCTVLPGLTLRSTRS